MTLKRPTAENAAEARALVYRCLARREYSRMELRQKLQRAGVAPAVADGVLEELTGLGVVDDRRFAESFTRARVERGYGPERLRYELRTHGLSDQMIADALAPYAREWQRRLERLAEKRRALDSRGDAASQARNARYLVRRGFNTQAVNDTVLKSLKRKGRVDDEEVE